MQQAVSARTPAHLWIVGALALVFNGYGAFDYTMTRMRNTDYIAKMGGSERHARLHGSTHADVCEVRLGPWRVGRACSVRCFC